MSLLDADAKGSATLRSTRSANRLKPGLTELARQRSSSGGDSQRPGVIKANKLTAKPATHTRDGSLGGVSRNSPRPAHSGSRWATGPPERPSLTPLPSIISSKPSDDLEDLVINGDASDSLIFIGIDFGTT